MKWGAGCMGEEKQAAYVAEIERELRYVSSWLKQRGREILSDYKITIPQFLALQWLFEAGDMTIGELSTKMFLAFSTTTDLIDRMEKHQLVQRVKDKKDRRVVRIHLLEEGERIIEEVINKRQQYLSGVLVNFSESDIVSLSETLAKLHQEMKEK
ncbi:MarR family winged helix-turn-helix transcriptional regulator [Peribacillus sp. NPDC096540]|uniref:MarR family winged helix-turn-helix transcriptional regulator n=1 Tax=Peribacillus sp. NPDC096540 TaxID=3390612 RepID=UPI003D04E793